MDFLRPAFRSLILVGLCAASVWAQAATPDVPQDAKPKPASLQIPLVVPSGTPLRVALPERIRILHPGAPVR